MGFLIGLGTKIVGGVGKLLKKIKEKKLIKAAKKEEAAKARTEAARALLGGAASATSGNVLSAAQQAVFGNPPAEPKGFDLMQFLKDNWKLIVPSSIGLVIVLIGLIVKSFKRRR